MAFGAVTILMDTLHQHFLLPTPRFPLRNKTKVKLLYKNLSSLQTSLEQDFKVGENDEALKGLEAQLRDVSVELRFQIEHHLRLFYLGKTMMLRLHSARKLLPILNRAIKDIKTMDLGSLLDILVKHLALPVSCMPAHIKKRVESFCTQHHRFLFYRYNIFYKQESDDEEESKNEQEVEVEQESKNEQQSEYEQENGDEHESNDEQESNNEQESEDEERRYMLYEAESIIRQELRASYLSKYMKQRIEARQRIRQIFTLGCKLTGFIKKELLKVKNACDKSKNSQNNNIVSLRGLKHDNITLGDSSWQTSKSTIQMVGCDDEFNMIMDNLNQQSLKREIISIVGMGGIGKTTLARRIYGDDSFISRFDCRAWVTISQEYNPRQVLQALLHSLAPRKDEINEASNNELAEQIYRRLKHQRYLIVVDDIWSIDVWDDLMRCFQDDNNASRVLLTTRLKNVADYAGSGSNSCHNKRFLGSYESWNLFCNKVLSERIILSPRFEILAREIVDKCKGLPLAISVAAGLLSNSRQTFNEWERIAQNVHTLSLDHSNQQCENIIHLSYTFLPHHLKFCFLSLGCFPRNYEVDEDMIVEFWGSEGFLKVLRSKSSEDVARGYLQDLVDRNLVQICEERNGKFSNIYKLHDVLRALSKREAEKENLLCFGKGFDIGLGCRRIQPINSPRISQPWSNLSRICNSNSLTHTTNTSSFIDIEDMHDHKNLHTHFKFLRALVICRRLMDDHNIFLEIMGLVHLRWLKIRSNLNFHCLPLFMMGNLQKLEFDGNGSCEPLNIWGLPQLRNLYIKHYFTLVPPSSVHHNLESISFLDYRSCTKELFTRIPNLRTLGVTTHPHINPKHKASNWFESVVRLYKLEELVVHDKLLHWEFRTIHSMGMLSLENFLPNLKKLELFRTGLKWKDMDVVGMLSELEVLILKFGAVDGKIWKPRDGGFQRLKLLDISECDLECWEATSGHFPVLECLVLRCTKLEEIPSGFADITTLKSIKLCEDYLFDRLHPLRSSAEHIREEQQEYGNDAFDVDTFRSPEMCMIA